jgi:hypothetical protein
MYVEPLRAVRPDWPIREISNADHLNCIFKSDFKTELESALETPGKSKP